MPRPLSFSSSLSFVLLAALSASAQTPQPSTRPLNRATAADIAAGKRMFGSQCAWCHGTDGDGGTGPTLQRPTLRRAADDAALVNIVRVGIPGTDMPGFAILLTPRMAWQTAAYVRSLGRGAARATTGDATRGAAVYTSTGCASCHYVRGEGGVLGPDLSAVGALRGPSHLKESLVDPGAKHPNGYLVVKVVMKDGTEVRGNLLNEDAFWVHLRVSSGAVRTIRRSDATQVDKETQGSLMPSYAKTLSAAQIDDLVAYLSSLRGEP